MVTKIKSTYINCAKSQMSTLETIITTMIMLVIIRNDHDYNYNESNNSNVSYDDYSDDCDVHNSDSG